MLLLAALLMDIIVPIPKHFPIPAYDKVILSDINLPWAASSSPLGPFYGSRLASDRTMELY